MNQNRALWEKGDFTRIAVAMRESGEALVRQIGITKEMRVLDLGCGDGTTAIPSAQIGASVLGVDIASNLVEAGNRRAKDLGLTNITFQQGDAADLSNLADHSFDFVVSIFGAMFAPNPFAVAKEMVRVTKPGGTIVMGNWIPNHPTLAAQTLKICSTYSPPPPDGFVSPMTWGVESHVLERFVGAGITKDQISMAQETWTFNYKGSPSALLEEFQRHFGPAMNAFEAAEKAGKADALHQELADLFNRENKSAHKDLTVIHATYLRVTVSV
jgi:ubiquinone/menaquinone biosynthesis C-methylase UbiE